VEAKLADFKGTRSRGDLQHRLHDQPGGNLRPGGTGDEILCDRLNHASIYDGIRLSGAELQRFRHRDLDHLEKLLKEAPAGRTRLIITDSVFSVDGDLAPLRELVELKDRHGALLMIDEAHATGVLGPKGAGLAEALGLTGRIDVHMGTFSKALGSLGGYVAGDRRLIHYLHNKARAFIYSTALPPPVLGAIDKALDLVRATPSAGIICWSRRIFSATDSAGRVLTPCPVKPRLSRCWRGRMPGPWSLPPDCGRRASWPWPCARPRCRRGRPE
jgi:8-amino-7-oxononanoate synthase